MPTIEDLQKRAQANQSQEEKTIAHQQARIATWKQQDLNNTSKYAGRSVSKLVNVIRMNTFVKTGLATAFLISGMLTVPYFMYLRHPVRTTGHSMRSGDYVFDPAVDGFGPMYLGIGVASVVILLLIIWLIGISGAPAQLEKEKRWMASLPFKMDGYLQALGQTDRERFVVRIRYDKFPEEIFMGNLLKSLNPQRITHNRNQNSPDEMTVDFESFWTASSKSGYQLHLLMHRLVNEILLPIHKDFPVKSVTVDEDFLEN